MKTHQTCPPEGGLTRLDLLALLATMVLLSLIVAPALANPRLRSDRVLCANNLRQLGMAMQLWGNDHGDAVPQEVPVSEGGTRAHPLAVNVWLHYSWLSNELRTPRLLFCPSESGRPARTFTGDSGGGYLHPNFANRATSYLLAHTTTGRPDDILSADRNIGFNDFSGCGRFNSANKAGAGSPLLRWDTNLHRQAGNVLAFDGRVAQLSNAGLDAYMTNLAKFRFVDGASFHYLLPR